MALKRFSACGSDGASMFAPRDLENDDCLKSTVVDDAPPGTMLSAELNLPTLLS